MRLIDADSIPWDVDGVGEIPVITKEEIDDMPTVDAVPVIRCKDCKYYADECCDRYADETLGYVHSTQPDFFCAVAERKDKNERVDCKQ